MPNDAARTACLHGNVRCSMIRAEARAAHTTPVPATRGFVAPSRSLFAFSFGQRSLQAACFCRTGPLPTGRRPPLSFVISHLTLAAPVQRDFSAGGLRPLVPPRGAWGTPRDAGERCGAVGQTPVGGEAVVRGGDGREGGPRPGTRGVPRWPVRRPGRARGMLPGRLRAGRPAAAPCARRDCGRPGACRSGSMPKLLALRRRARYKRLSEPPSGVEGGTGRGLREPPRADPRRYLQIRHGRGRLARPRAEEGGSDRRFAPWS